jgi:hypothetical protein
MAEKSFCTGSDDAAPCDDVLAVAAEAPLWACKDINAISMSPLRGDVGGAEVAHLLAPGTACAKALVVAVEVELVDEEDDVAELDESLDSNVESN